MELDYALNEKEHRSAQWLVMKPRPVFAVIGVLLIALFIWGVWYSLFSLTNPSLYWTRYVMPGLFIYLVLSFAVYRPYRWNQIYRKQKSLSRDVRLTVVPEGLRFADENGDSLVPWSDYTDWKENNSIFLLFLSPVLFQAIPKRAFQDSSAVDEFRELLKSRTRRA